MSATSPQIRFQGRSRGDLRKLKYTFDRFIRVAARTADRSSQDPLDLLVLALAADPDLPLGIRSKIDIERYICTPGSSEQALADWSKLAWSEVLPYTPNAIDALWEVYVQWRRHVKRSRRTGTRPSGLTSIR